MKAEFWHNSVVYQVYPKSFRDTTGSGTGDIPGIIEKLDYLGQLGIDVIWLSPVYPSPMEDNGYDIADYQGIHEEFGTMEDMEHLIAEGKKRGIRIVMDLVVNHTSREHVWFREACRSRESQYRDFYIWRDEPNDMSSVFGGSAWEYHEATEQYYFHNFAVGQPDLNWENEEVVSKVFAMMNWWLEKGIGGFRMDVIDLIGKDIDRKILANGPRLHPLLQRMNRETFGQYDVLTVGETWGADPDIGKLYSDPARKELNMIFQFEHMQLDWGDQGKWTPRELDLVGLKRILAKWQNCFDGDGWNSLFWNNHDLPRIVSRWGDDGESRVESAKMLAMVLHLMKGTPYVYQGEELGMTNVRFDSLEEYDDVEIHGSYEDLVRRDKALTHEQFMEGVYRMGRDNARTPMQWDDSENAGFTSGTPWLKVNPNYRDINAARALADEYSVFHCYRRLIELRRNSPWSDLIVYGDFTLLREEDEHIFSYERSRNGRTLVLTANFSGETVPFDGETAGDVLLSNYAGREAGVLRPYEAFVVVES